MDEEFTAAGPRAGDIPNFYDARCKENGGPHHERWSRPPRSCPESAAIAKRGMQFISMCDRFRIIKITGIGTWMQRNQRNEKRRVLARANPKGRFSRNVRIERSRRAKNLFSISIMQDTRKGNDKSN